MNAAKSLSNEIPISEACASLGVPRSSFYRAQCPKKKPVEGDNKSKPPLALSDQEKRSVIELLHDGRFADKTPYELYGSLLDEGEYVCSIRTMYRYLAEIGESKERRRNEDGRSCGSNYQAKGRYGRLICCLRSCRESSSWTSLEELTKSLHI